MRLSEEETKAEMDFIDILFTRDAVMQFGVSPGGRVSVITRINSRTIVFSFRVEHARVLALGIQRVCAGDDQLTRAFEPISDQLLDMVGRIEHGVDARRSRT